MTMPFPSVTEEISDEEFYRVCSARLEEVYSFPVSFEEKRQLQYLIYETMQRYEEGKIIHKETEENSIKLGKNLSLLTDSLCEIAKNAGKIEENLRVALLNGQIAATQMKETMGVLKEAKQYADQTKVNLDYATGDIEQAGEEISGLSKKIKKIEREVKVIKKGYERNLDAKDTVIEIMNGIRSQDSKPQSAQ
jgi:hypothetical protein